MQTNQMVFYYEDPVAFLNDQFRERQKKNPRFSLRAWARQLGYENPSMLFQVLKGERRLKMELATKAAENLQLKGKSLKYFELITLAKASGSDTERQMLQEMSNKMKPKAVRAASVSVSHDVFAAISDWYHQAIMWLAELPTFEEDPTWIQQQLGNDIDKKTIKAATDRLLRAGLMVRKENGRLGKASDEQVAFLLESVQIPSSFIRKYHTEMIGRAADSVEKQTMNERDLRGTTLTFNKKNLAQVADILAEAHRQIGDLATADGDSEVYQLNSQFFRLTKKRTDGDH